MDWGILIGLIVFGLLLVVVEIIFVPGTTFVGLIGFLITVTGIYLTYLKDNTSGHIALAASISVFIIFLVIGFKAGIWERLSLKTTISAKVSPSLEGKVNVRDVGKTISALRPIGKIEINNTFYEARTQGNFCEANTEVVVIKVDHNKIFVEPLNS